MFVIHFAGNLIFAAHNIVHQYLHVSERLLSGGSELCKIGTRGYTAKTSPNTRITSHIAAVLSEQYVLRDKTWTDLLVLVIPVNWLDGWHDPPL